MFTVDCLKTLSFVNLESGQPGGFETSTSKVNLEFIGNSKFPRSKTTDSQCCRQLTWLAFWPDGDLHRKPANSKFRSLEDECNWILSGREPVLGTSFTPATNNTILHHQCLNWEDLYGYFHALFSVESSKVPTIWEGTPAWVICNPVLGNLKKPAMGS